MALGLDLEYRWTVITVTTVGVLMSGLDSRIVVIGLPQVASALRADAEQAIWFTQAYVLGSTATLLLVGRISDIFGRVRIYTIGFGIFTLGSLLTSLSQTPAELIAFRFLQGIGSAILFANSSAIITDATPVDKLGLALGINQIAFRAGAMLGLTLSGLILSFLDWRALFYVNVPIGIFGTIWAKRRLIETKNQSMGEPLDIPGFILFTLSITFILLSLSFSAYGSSFIYLSLPFAFAGILLVFFFYFVERRKKSPLLDLSLLSIREFTGGIIAQLLNAVAWGAMMLLLSLYLQLVKGMEPFTAGLSLIPFDVAFLSVGPLSGRLSDKYGYLPFTLAGLTAMSISLFLLSTISVSTSYFVFIMYVVIFGIGIGLFSSPNMSSIMKSVPPRRRGVASALRATFFNVGFTMSFNIVILVMASSVPYSILTRIISLQESASSHFYDIFDFTNALKAAFFWLGVVNSVAIFPAALRARNKINNNKIPVPDVQDRGRC
jgi:EmrB/QacA subfamily drug resistance transporter